MFLNDITPYGGSAWLALSWDASKYIITFLEKNNKLLKFYKHTSHPDEMIFQTILMNSPYKDKITCNLTYTDWSDNTPRLRTIQESHLKKFKEMDKVITRDVYGEREVLFARKFSEDRQDIIDFLDILIKDKNIKYKKIIGR